MRILRLRSMTRIPNFITAKQKTFVSHNLLYFRLSRYGDMRAILSIHCLCSLDSTKLVRYNYTPPHPRVP